MKLCKWMLGLVGIAALAGIKPAKAQSPAVSSGVPAATALPVSGPTHLQLDLTYTRPSEKRKFHNYLFDAFGPYPILNAAAFGAYDQWDNAPPEWKQGAGAYGERFASNYAIGAVATTTRYALAEVFRQDVLYYRCGCTGVLPRFSHAVLSTVTARRGDDGHHVFSFVTLAAPYAGTMTAVYGWYPARYDAMDAFRLGNYRLLGYVGQNLFLEFFYSRKPHSWLSRMHLSNGEGTPGPRPQP